MEDRSDRGRKREQRTVFLHFGFDCVIVVFDPVSGACRGTRQSLLQNGADRPTAQFSVATKKRETKFDFEHRMRRSGNCFVLLLAGRKFLYLQSVLGA